MTLKLVVTTNVNGDVFELVLKNARYGVGRGNDNDLRIEETYISGYHAELTRTESGDYLLSDLGSSNGTFLNGLRVEGKKEIKAGDFIKFGILKVAVGEQGDFIPKMVSLKEKPAFARRDESNTAAIRFEKETGPGSDLQAAKAEANALRLDLKRAREESEFSLLGIEKTLKGRIAELETTLGSELVISGDALSRNTALETELDELRKRNESFGEEVLQLKARNGESSRNSGRLQAELNRETADRSQILEELEATRKRSNQLVDQVETLKQALDGKDRELAERERQYSRSESEMAQKLKRELGELRLALGAADEKAEKAVKEKLSLGRAFERLKAQLDQSEAAHRRAKEAEAELLHGKGLLARRLEKSEACNSELASRIKEEALALIAGTSLIEKLERQLRENEIESARREHEKVAALQSDISQRRRRSAEEERRRVELESELAGAREAKRQSDERVLGLNERILEMESETLSTRNLLTDTGKKRGELFSRLAEESALVESHARTIALLREELADTISRFTASEVEMIGRHGNETDELVAELHRERSLREGLEIELSNTRTGMSEALRHAREESVAARAKLVIDGNAKLSVVEDSLSEVIRSREEIERARNALEDDLNQREEKIERLSERIEDLEIQIRDEVEARQLVLRNFQMTKEGLSESLHANRGHLEKARSQHEIEKKSREKSEVALVSATEEISRLVAASEDQDHRFRTEIQNWEERYASFREEKLALTGEDANLKKIREEIAEASKEKREIESELTKLNSGLSELQRHHCELQAQKDALLGEREEARVELDLARSEFDSVQKRCAESKARAAKLADTIAAAERRIQSLRKLESEMEHVVERKRQQNILSRGDVFSTRIEPFADNGELSKEDFYRKFITKLDLLDDLTKRYENKWRYPKVAEQLALLKRGFVDFLQDHSVRPFDLEPGTVLSVAERRRIKLVFLENRIARTSEADGNGNGNRNGTIPYSSHVVETIRPGYVYQDGCKDVIIRKAEVVVS